MVTTPIRGQHPPRRAGWSGISAIVRRLRRTSDTFRGTEDPAGVSGHLRGLGRILEHAVGRCPRNRDFKVVPASLDAAREWQRGYGEALGLLSPEPTGLA
jgi:hypothetical protein